MRQYFDCPAKRDLWARVKDLIRTDKCNRRSFDSIFSRKEDKMQLEISVNHSDEAKQGAGSLYLKEPHLKRTIFKDHDLVCFVVNPVFISFITVR